MRGNNEKEVCTALCVLPAALVSMVVAVALPRLFFAFLTGDPLATVVPRVDKGTLYALDLGDQGAVTYNLSAVFSFRSPGSNLWKVSIKDLAAVPLYGGRELCPEARLLPSSFQLSPRTTMMVPLDVQGRRQMDGHDKEEVARTYAQDAARGYFTVEARIQVQEGHGQGSINYFLCTLYFPPPTTTRGGGPDLFDGEYCRLQSTADTEYLLALSVILFAGIFSLFLFALLFLCCFGEAISEIFRPRRRGYL